MNTIQGYSQVEIIYSGHKSVLYKALKNSTGEVVAIKTKQLTSVYERENIKKEYSLLSSLDIEEVPNAYELADNGEKLFFEMEYLPYKSLNKVIKNKEITLIAKLEIFEKAARILEKIHEQDIIHRDITPNNILCDVENHIVKIIDFGAAVDLSFKSITGAKLENIQGTYSYMSPEQTGRVNRKLDYRTDIYSFGISFYQMLTGQLPFITNDISKIVYSHIAVVPTPPNMINLEIPEIISNIVMKCIEKKPQSRYQSAKALGNDIRRCREELSSNGVIVPFVLSTEEVYNKFIIPDKVYGREKELEQLISIYNNRHIMRNILVLISGYSGIGKTSIFDQFATEIKGNVVKGKYEQYNRAIPYFAIIEIFTVLINQILTKSEKEIENWKSRILNVIGNNGKILTYIIPRLEMLIGEQCDVQELSFDENKIRINKAFKDLFTAFENTENPLIIFLDDIQWIDQPSLVLLESIIVRSDIDILFIASYRNNEVTNSHPLSVALKAMKEKKATIIEIELEPIKKEAVLELIRDTLKINNGDILVLGNMLYEKTKGNPFFVKTLLSSIYEKNQIKYDYKKNKWTWDNDIISQIPYSENVVDALQERIDMLPQETIDLLKLGACMNIFDPKFISFYLNITNAEVIENLKPAVKYNLIFSLVENTNNNRMYFKFSHDRIEQASYSYASEKELANIHLNITRKMFEYYELEEIENEIFDLCNHIIKGIEILDDADEQLKYSKILYRAGKRAKESVAFEDAAELLTYSKQMLGKNAWEDDYETTFSVYIELYQLLFLIFKYEEADEIGKTIKENLKGEHDLILLYRMQAKRYHQHAKYDEAIEIGFKGLELLEINLPNDKTEALEMFEIEELKINKMLEMKNVDDFYNSVENERVEHSLRLELLLGLYVDVYVVGNQELLAVISAKMTRLSMEYGNSIFSSLGYVYYGLTLTSYEIDYHLAYSFGQLAVKLAEKYNDSILLNFTYHVFALGVNHWIMPLKDSLSYWEKGSKLYLAAISTYSGYTYLELSHVKFAMGLPISEVEVQIYETYDFLTTYGHEGIIVLLQLQVDQPVKHLKGLTTSISSLDDDSFNSEKFMETFGQHDFFMGSYYYPMLRVSYFAGEILSLETLIKYITVIETTQLGQIIVADSYMFYVLNLINSRDKAIESEKESYQKYIDDGIEKMKKWAELSHSNFMHKYLLLEAENNKGKISSDKIIVLYDNAIDKALEEKFIQDAAIICEKAGMFWLNNKSKRIAKSYLEQAYVLYERWGATIKVKELLKLYGDLLIEKLNLIDSNEGLYLNESSSSMDTTSSFSNKLDYLSIIKASQVISKHIVYEDVVETLLEIIIENAGATKGVLIVKENGKYLVDTVLVKGEYGNNIVREYMPYEESISIPVSVVNYSLRIKETVKLEDGITDIQFSDSEYIKSQNMHSICCIPIKQKNEIKAFVYLEHSDLSSAFRKDCESIVNILAKQAIIVMENALIYQRLEKMVEKRTEELNDKNILLNEQNRELEVLSTTDQLTNIYNRRYIEEKLYEIIDICGFQDKCLSLILIDVDHFKKVNDKFGHNVGDEVLIKIANVIKETIREKYILGRWCGEEFIILLPEINEVGSDIATRIRKSVENSKYQLVGSVTISGGVTDYKKGDTLSSIVSRADIGLYLAKENGRNRIETIE